MQKKNTTTTATITTTTTTAINYTKCLGRESHEATMRAFLLQQEQTDKKGLYVCGPSGCGKTTFVKNVLRELNFDAIFFDGGDVRNKSAIEQLQKHNMPNHNIYSKPIVFVMDEIDAMNNGDKGGLSALIKLVRSKKTKKQKQELSTHCPIICIGNHLSDKKTKELIKVCSLIELQEPNASQVRALLKAEGCTTDEDCDVLSAICRTDLRKLQKYISLYRHAPQRQVIAFCQTLTL